MVRISNIYILHKLLILFSAILFLAGPSVALTIGTWDVFEINLTSKKYSNPYTDVWVNATFIGPTKSIKIYGFWDGGQNWKIRMAPTEAGAWSYTTKSNDPQLNGQTGSFEVIESAKKGFIIVDPDYPFAFKRSNGEHVLLMGDTCWNCISDRNGALNFSTYMSLIDKRSIQKFNFIRSYIISLYSKSSIDANYNEGGRAFEPWNPDSLNPKYFQEADKRIEYANSKGIAMHLLLGGDKTLMTDFFSWDNGKMERYVRYIASRYSAYEIAWEGRAEYGEQRIKTPGAVNLANQIGIWLKEYDPYTHIQSIHPGGSSAQPNNTDSNHELGGENWLSWIMHQSRDWDLITEDRKYYKPVMNEEFYYEDSGAGAKNPHHKDAVTVRKGAWNIMTHGASGFAYGNTGTYNSRSQPFKGIEYSQSRGADYMTYLYKFWNETEYWKLTPNNEIIVYGTASSVINENEYIIYFSKGGSVGIDFNGIECNLISEWYNPRNGTFQGRTIIEGGALTHFKAQNSEDWILYINSIDGCFTPNQSVGTSKNNLFYKLLSPFINFYKILKYKIR